MLDFLRRLFSFGRAADRGPSLPLDLARRGWRPHKFPNSQVVVFLPRNIPAQFGQDGVLYGPKDGEEVVFSATLHGGFEENPAAALGFVARLAKKKRRKVRERGTYRYFFDPAGAGPEARADRFWVIGIPGAVVVVSILHVGKVPVTDALREVRREIPHIIGELM